MENAPSMTAEDTALPEETAFFSPERQGELVQRRIAMMQRFRRAYQHVEDSMLAPHQVDAMDGFNDFVCMRLPSDMDDGLTKRGVLVHAPGAGKTVFAATVAKFFGVGERPSPGERPIRALVLAHERRVVIQDMGLGDEDSDTARGFTLVAPDIDAKMCTLRSDLQTPSVVGMTYYSLLRAMHRDPTQFNTFDLVIYDECHEALGAKVSEAIRELQRGKINLALTGSPELVGKTVYPLWPHKIHEISMREGIEARGILNSFLLYTIKTGEVLEGKIQDNDYSSKELRKLAESELINSYVTRIAKNMAAHNIKTVIFGIRGEQSKYSRDLAAALDGTEVVDRATMQPRSIAARAVGAFRRSKSNDAIFEEFDEGKIDILTTSKMGDTGWDPADLGCIVLVCPTRSARVIIQRLGRGARLGKMPTVVIHFDYEVQSQRNPQMTPYDVFGVSPTQGLLIEPRSKRYKSNVQQKEEAEILEEMEPFLTDIRSMAQEAELRVARRQYLRRSVRPGLPEGFTHIDDITQEYNLMGEYVAMLLRRTGHIVISLLSQNDELQRYSDEKQAREFIETRMAPAGHITRQDIARELGVAITWIDDNLDGSLGERRFPRNKADHKTALPLFFDPNIIEVLRQKIDKTGTLIRDDEMSVTEILDVLTRSDRSVASPYQAVHKWFGARGIEPTLRRLDGKSKGGRPCYPRKYKEAILADLDVRPVPDTPMHVPIRTVFNQIRALHPYEFGDSLALVRHLGVEVRRYRSAKGIASQYVTKQDSDFIKERLRDIRAKGKLGELMMRMAQANQESSGTLEG
ncbi:MAG: DEAD/DEAH box helicase [Candidatus Saccharibacteria bacterium]